MKILCNDIGTGTQDIALFDTRLDIENCYKLVLPSPTMIINRKLKRAAKEGAAVLLTGSMMGGGPSTWGAEEVLRHGGKVYATAEAAKTFNDDLSQVEKMGVVLVSEDEAQKLSNHVLRVQFTDFDFEAIRAAFANFGVDLSLLDAVAVAVFDHGAAPKEISDRKFRFDYLDERIRKENRLSAFAYRADQIPSSMTRLQAAAAAARGIDAPVVVMDTAPAAVLGATFDPLLADREEVIIANVGNFHTLAFRLSQNSIDGVFEHHTGLVNRAKLENYLSSLADGSLSNTEIFDDHGHGSLVYKKTTMPIPKEPYGVVVTGPRRKMMRGSSLNPYFAAPYGDMMIAGCYGLLAAVGDTLPEFKTEIVDAMKRQSTEGTPPWEVDA